MTKKILPLSIWSFQPWVWPAGWRLVLPQLRRPHVHLDRADQAGRLFHRRSPHVPLVRLVHSSMNHLTPQSTPSSKYMPYCELAFFRIYISFGSKMVNAGAFLGALCEYLPIFFPGDSFLIHAPQQCLYSVFDQTFSDNMTTVCYFMAFTWWWIDFVRLNTGHWERFLNNMYSMYFLIHQHHSGRHIAAAPQGRLRQLPLHRQQVVAEWR